MEVKKNPSLETSTLSNLFFTGGLVVALGLTIFAFEYKTYDEIEKAEAKAEVISEQVMTLEDIPVTTQQAAPVAPPPPEPEFKVAKEEAKEEDPIEDDKKKNTDVITPPGDTTKKKGPPIVFNNPPPVEQPKDEILDVVQKKAGFPGGDKEYTKFLSSNLKYPNSALRNNIEGTVYVRFIVDKDGSIIKDCVKVAKSVDPALDAEAVRVVRMSPNWTPALQNERPTKQRIRVPVKFKIAK